MEHILEKIRQERTRQDEKWGKQHHSQTFWATILMEEVGEACQEINDMCNEKVSTDYGINDNLKKELVQVAAVVVAWLEDLN